MPKKAMDAKGKGLEKSEATLPWVTMGMREDWQREVEMAEGRNKLRTEEAFTKGHVYETPIAVPLEMSMSTDDWDSMKKLHRQIQTPVIDVAIANLQQYYQQFVGQPSSCVIGTHIAPLTDPTTKVMQPVWSVTGHYFVLINEGEILDSGHHVVCVLDSNMHRTWASVQEHGNTNGPIIDAAASLMKNVEGLELYIRYLPCLQQSVSTACGVFSIANSLLYCLFKSGEASGSLSTAYSKSGQCDKLV